MRHKNMKLRLIKTLAVGMASIALANCTNQKTSTTEMTKAPIAEKIPHEFTIHGDTRIDNYHWLRDMDRKDPKILAYLEAENEYTNEILKPTENLQKELFEEIKGRIKQDDSSVPYFLEGYYYYTRYETGKEYPIYCRKAESLDNPEEVMLNGNELAEGLSYYQIGSYQVSDNNEMIGYSEDTLSRRIYDLKFKKIALGEYLSDVISGTTGNFVWAADNKTIFYTKREETTLRAHKIFKHVLGTDQSEDVEVFYESDETFNVGVGRSKSKKWIYIHSGSTVSDEYQMIEAIKPESKWKLFQPRERDLEYRLAHFENQFYIITNYEAKNFRVMVTAEDQPLKEQWQEVIPHRKDVLLEDIDLFSNHLVLSEKSKGQSSLRVINQTTKEDHYLEFDEEVYTVWAGSNPQFNTEILRISYQSLTTPASVIDYHMNERSMELLKEKEVLGGFNKDDYESKRLWVTARDGAKVPVSMVYKKDIEFSAETPLLLYGYGSYGATMDPYFSPSRLSLLNRGFVFAIAHIRGSQMLGRPWYEDGKMLNKKNTFYDFIDCAKYLVHKQYTSEDHLYAMGGSAGGLLMGAIINMEPNLWNGVIAAVPFVDVVTTMLDESIPLTTGEFDEWGNPKNEEYYHYIKSYSPYDNVEQKDYPHLLVTTGLHDSQVQYWEPAKWVAKLRDLKTDQNMLLLKTNMEYGHGGASGRFEAYKEIAMEYAFLLHLEEESKGL